ncbi:MAG: helix-turn-helix domain-containing protein [Lactobacillaceae bacterium]|jgi:DNA-binding XRE family transcriptional regulator|nr:helix-turn-helix domain-containing protein [Lactobacillaceae bacterium]
MWGFRELNDEELTKVLGGSVGKNIRMIRNHFCLSQDQLADKLYVTRQSVSKWENEVDLPDLATMMKIREKLDVSIDDLVDLSEVDILDKLKKNSN